MQALTAIPGSGNARFSPGRLGEASHDSTTLTGICEGREAGEMFSTVIVPLDGSPHAEFAISCAVDEARRHGARLVLMHVIARPEPCTTVRKSGPYAWQGEWPFEELSQEKRDALAYLNDVVRRFALDPATTLRVEVGDPGVRVTDVAKCYPKPLVVMLTGDCTRESCPPLSLVASFLMIAGTTPVLGIRQPCGFQEPRPFAETQTVPVLISSGPQDHAGQCTSFHSESGLPYRTAMGERGTSLGDVA